MSVIYTLGYTGWQYSGIDAALDKVSMSKPAILVDVRYRAASMHWKWRGVFLMEHFGKRYTHAPPLGNVNYKGDGPIMIADLGRGLPIVVQLMEKHTVILMCGCPNAVTCHRRVVARQLAKSLDDGSNIMHFTKPKRTR